MKHKLFKLCTLVMTCLAIMATISAAIPVSAANTRQNIAVTLDSTKIKFPDQQPFTENGSILVPVRFVAEAMGYTVKWDKNNGTAVIDGGNIVLYIGTNKAVINGKNVKLSSSSKVMNNRTMVSPKLLAELLEVTAEWSAKDNTLNVKKKAAPVTPEVPETPIEQKPNVSLFDTFKNSGQFWNFKTSENEYLVSKTYFKSADEAKKAGYYKWWIERPLNEEDLVNQSFDCSICAKSFTADELKAIKNMLKTAYPTGYEKVYDIMLKSIKGELWQTFVAYDSELYPLYSALPPRSGTYGTTYYDKREVEMYVNDTCTLLTINLSDTGYINPETPRTLSKDEIAGYTALAKQHYCLELWGLK